MRTLCLLLLTLLAVGCPSKEEVLEKAEESGKFLVEKKASLVKGVGEGLKGGGKEGAESLSEGVGEVLRGAAKGFDNSLGAVKVEAVEALGTAGVKVERGARHGEDGKHGITLYLVFEQAFEGRLLLRALDAEGHEVGRSTAEEKRAAGDAGYVDFAFDERVPLLTVDHVELQPPTA